MAKIEECKEVRYWRVLLKRSWYVWPACAACKERGPKRPRHQAWH